MERHGGIAFGLEETRMVCGRRLQLAALIVALLIGRPGESASQGRTPVIPTLDVTVPAAPALVRVAGTRYLVYELHLTNFARAEVTLLGVEVLDAGRGAALGRFREAGLEGLIGRPGASAADPGVRRVVGPGMRAVVYLWLALDNAAPTPGAVRHRIELSVIRGTGREQISVDTAATEVRAEAALVLSPPLRGGPWVALYDPRLIGGHRTSIYALGGRARIPARFAIDWVRLEPDGTHARGDASRIANWYGYGADVLAVADAIVVEARDDVDEEPSLERAPGAPRTPVPLENVSGNFVCLDLGGGRYAFYEHLQHGSLTVKAGERVKTGQVIGRLGNSGGSSSGPHLHFHVADTPSELAGEGVPYVFRRFDVIGAFDTIDGFAAGRPWGAATNGAGPRENELPAPNVVVRF